MEEATTGGPARLRLGVAAALSAALATAPAAVPARAQGTAPRTEANAKAEALLGRLRGEVEQVEARLDGVLGLYAEDVAGGSVIERNADLTFATASAIKPAILYELYRQAEEGRIDLLETTQPGLPRVGGGGVLEKLGGAVRLSWRDVAVLMMVWSDNEATNVLIRRLGLQAVNARLDSLGLARTRLRRQMMDLDAARRGDENVATPRELARLSRVIAAGQGLSPDRARDLLALATLPAEGSPFRRGLPEGVRALAKPGSLEGVRAEVAWVDLPGRPYTAAIMTGYLAREADGEAAITQLSAALFSTFDRLARSSDHGRVISERDARK